MNRYGWLIVAVWVCAFPAEVRGQMVLEDRELPVTEARDEPARVKQVMPEERSMVVNRQARLVWDEKEGLYRLAFLHEPGKPDEWPRYALPNSRLELIEEEVLQDYPEAVFTVSGETTIYGRTASEKKAYLLIRLATVKLPDGPARRPVATTQPVTSQSASRPALSADEEWLLSDPDDEGLVADAADAAATPPVPAVSATSDDPAAEATSREATSRPVGGDADDIILALLQERPGTPILAPSETATPVDPSPSVAPLPEAIREQQPTMFGSMLTERVVRLGQDKEGWWLLRFENANALSQPSLRVLPNSNLTKARSLSRSTTGVELRLIVWGEVVQYKGTQYILIRRVAKYQPMTRF